jgi:hypothetical protein
MRSTKSPNLELYNICVMFGGRVFQQTVGIPMDTNCAPVLIDLFLYSYEADCIQGLLKKNEKKLARTFIFTFRYIDDVLSLNNSRFLVISLIESIPLSYKSTRGGAHIVPICILTVSSIFMISVSKNLLVESEWYLVFVFTSIREKL